jgi:hypothetical protein
LTDDYPLTAVDFTANAITCSIAHRPYRIDRQIAMVYFAVDFLLPCIVGWFDRL